MLRALGRDDRLAESSLRFSFGRFSTEADVDAAVSGGARGAVERLRRIGGRMNYNDLTRRYFENAALAPAC